MFETEEKINHRLAQMSAAGTKKENKKENNIDNKKILNTKDSLDPSIFTDPIALLGFGYNKICFSELGELTPFGLLGIIESLATHPQLSVIVAI